MNIVPYRLRFVFFIILFSVHIDSIHAVELNIKEQICTRLSNCHSDSSKVIWLGQLIEYYNVYKDFEHVDSLFTEQIAISELSRNSNYSKLSIQNLINLEIYNFLENKDYERIENYLSKAILYCNTKNFQNEEVFLLIRKTELYVSKGSIKEAILYSEKAYNQAVGLSNDTLIIATNLNKAFVLINNNQVLQAYKLLINTLQSANRLEDYKLISQTYRRIAYLYDYLNDKTQNIKNLNYSLEVNEKNKDTAAMVDDLLSIARINDYEIGKKYIEKALGLCKSTIEFYRYKILSYRYLFTFTMMEGNSEKSFQFLRDHPEFEQFHKNQGEEHMNYFYADIYLYSNKLDSSLKYYNKLEQYVESNYGNRNKGYYYNEVSDIYFKKNKIPLAILYAKKSYSLFVSLGQLNSIKNTALSLKELYSSIGDYKTSLYYSDQVKLYDDSINTINKGKELTFLELENEKKKTEYELYKTEQKNIEKHRIQYAGITFIIFLSFIVLILFGFFTVNTKVIKILGFFSILFLFEFIVMIIDKYVHHFTHEEPIYIWIFKIVLFSILLPLHHKVEQRVIEYLNSRQLIELKDLFGRKKTTPIQSNSKNTKNRKGA